MRHWFVAHNYFQLSIQLLVGAVVYGLGLLWAIWTRKAWTVANVHYEETANEIAIGVIETIQQENEA
jgi:hypothetical protein